MRLSPAGSFFSLAAASRTIVTCLLILLFVLFSLSPENAFADFSINPSITLGEEYTDNVFESNHKRSDYVTRAMPGLALTYVMPFWDWDVAYFYDYRYYARNSRSSDDTHNLMAKGFIRLIDDFLLLDINDTYRRESLDVSRDRTEEGLFVDQSDTNNFTVSPYLQFHPTSQTTVKTGYRYTNIWYKEPSGIDRRDHIGFIDIAYDYSSRLTLMANHTYTHDNSIAGFDRHLPYIGGRYQYGERSFILALGGFVFDNPEHGSNCNKPYWNVGITHFFDHTSITLASVTLYPVDPEETLTRQTDYSLGVNRELSRGSVGITFSYSDFSGPDIDTDKRYGARLTVRHELLPNLSGNLMCSVDRYDRRFTDDHLRRIIVNPSLSYALPNEFTIGLYYYYIDSHSSHVPEDKYNVNRVGIQLTKTFGREVERIRTAYGGQ